ncbi:mannonate dehydratase [Rhodobacteraceae bacterium nBUS_24]
MKQTWRWFGPKDLVSVDHMVQAGAQGVVSALHHIPPGEIWSQTEIQKRQKDIRSMQNGRASSLNWDVVESLPVSEDIKKQKGEWRQHIQTYCQSLENLASSGLEVVCYNFMPVLDWTRTHLRWPLETGATCMRFDVIDFIVFDVHILKRLGAQESYSKDHQEKAARRFKQFSSDQITQLSKNIISGLPGAAGGFSLDDIRAHLQDYETVSEHRLRANLVDFLEQVIPTAERLGIRMCCHPDDPPVPLLGLPRIMSTEADYQRLIDAVDLTANGITLCTGSLGARPDNDLPGMMQRLGSRVHFLHLRNVKRDSNEIGGSFYEAEHLGGDTDMVAVIEAALKEEQRRKTAGRKDISIPFRPDHGQDILDDLKRQTQPGYPAIGRLKGLAELRGVIAALEPKIRAGII